MAKTTLTLDIEYDPEATDPESLASAADRLLKTALSTPGIMDDYGNPHFGDFFVVDAAENPPRPRPTVVVDIAGGVLQVAYSSEPALRLMLVDWDTDGPDNDRDIVEVASGYGHTQHAYVTEFPMVSIAELPGTDDGRALEKAGIVCEPDAEAGLQVRRRWILYSFDTDTLLTTQVFGSYREAADSTEQVDDVLVLPLSFRGITT